MTGSGSPNRLVHPGRRARGSTGIGREERRRPGGWSLLPSSGKVVGKVRNRASVTPMIPVGDCRVRAEERDAGGVLDTGRLAGTDAEPGAWDSGGGIIAPALGRDLLLPAQYMLRHEMSSARREQRKIGHKNSSHG